MRNGERHPSSGDRIANVKTYTVVLSPNEGSSYWSVTCPAMPGSVSQGIGRKGALKNILEAMEGDIKHGPRLVPGYDPITADFFRPMFRNALIVNSGFDYQKAINYITAGHADAVAFGALFIANPDLPERFRRFGAAAPLNAGNPATYYGSGEVGYIDYPALADS